MASHPLPWKYFFIEGHSNVPERPLLIPPMIADGVEKVLYVNIVPTGEFCMVTFELRKHIIALAKIPEQKRMRNIVHDKIFEKMQIAAGINLGGPNPLVSTLHDQPIVFRHLNGDAQFRCGIWDLNQLGGEGLELNKSQILGHEFEDKDDSPMPGGWERHTSISAIRNNLVTIYPDNNIVMIIGGCRVINNARRAEVSATVTAARAIAAHTPTTANKQRLAEVNEMFWSSNQGRNQVERDAHQYMVDELRFDEGLRGLSIHDRGISPPNTPPPGAMQGVSSGPVPLSYDEMVQHTTYNPTKLPDIVVQINSDDEDGDGDGDGNSMNIGGKKRVTTRKRARKGKRTRKRKRVRKGKRKTTHRRKGKRISKGKR